MRMPFDTRATDLAGHLVKKMLGSTYRSFGVALG